MYCPHCGARLGADMLESTETAKCLSCEWTFFLWDAVSEPGNARALTVPKSLRTQLDKMAKGPRR
jgi:hypothetical protein